MPEKSHVSMEQAVCPVCCKTHDTGSILLDKRMRASMERHTVTGWQVCAEDKAKMDEGFIPLVGIDESKSRRLHNGNISPDGAYRTGKLAYIKRSVWGRVINVPAPPEFCFVEDAVIDKLMAMQGSTDG